MSCIRAELNQDHLSFSGLERRNFPRGHVVIRRSMEAVEA
jgi:hypothetical protein